MSRLPKDIETVTERNIPQKDLDQPVAYERISETKTRELDIFPTRFVKHETMRPKFKKKNKLDAV